MRAAVAVLLLAACTATAAPPAPGDTVADFTFKDTHFLSRSTADFPKAKAVVLFFTDCGCPLAARYLPRLAKLEAEYRDRGVQFLAINAGPDDTLVDAAAQAVEAGLEFPAVKDPDGSVATAVGVERLAEVAVLDARRVLRYRGRIDDQYRPGGNRPAPTRHDLREALDAVLAGKEVAIPTTPGDGCRISRKQPPADAPAVTFAEHVAPLLRKHCADCHVEGGPAPFALTTYEEVRSRSRAVAEVVAEGRMPPWYGAPGHGPFLNRRGLTPAERDVVARWVAGGRARGDATKEPPAPPAHQAEAWRIGEPDLVLSTGVEELPAEGDVPYRYLIFPRVFLSETWVKAIEIRPDNPKVVHHANLAWAAFGKGIDESNFITGLVPGSGPMRLPAGVAVRLPPASVLGLQCHFVTTGKVEKCRIRVGIRFADGPVRQQLRHVLAEAKGFRIPAGAPAHAVSAARTLEHDALGVGLFAHMHVRGKAMRFRATVPGGEAETLLTIPNYSFDWQTPYEWEAGAKRLPKGTRLEVTAWYDNSAFNPFNPDPTAVVRHGPQTNDEMLNGFFFYVADGEDLGLVADGKTGRARPAAKVGP